MRSFFVSLPFNQEIAQAAEHDSEISCFILYCIFWLIMCLPLCISCFCL